MALAVITREPARAAPYARALEALGLTALAMPVTTTVAVAPATLAAALADLRLGDVVALASATAAELVAAALPSTARVAARWWAVGERTAAPLRALGYAVEVAERASATGLAAAILAGAGAPAGGRVLVPRAAEGRDEAVQMLRSAGVDVREVVAYETAAVSPHAPELAAALARWRAGEVQVVALFAPSQVVALDAALAAHGLSLRAPELVCAAIGETTAGALRAVGVAAPAVAESPTAEAMANAVRARYPRGR